MGNWAEEIGWFIEKMMYLCLGLLILTPILIGIIIYLLVK